jgi:hypothetical protein
VATSDAADVYQIYVETFGAVRDALQAHDRDRIWAIAAEARKGLRDAGLASMVAWNDAMTNRPRRSDAHLRRTLAALANLE